MAIVFFGEWILFIIPNEARTKDDRSLENLVEKVKMNKKKETTERKLGLFFNRGTGGGGVFFCGRKGSIRFSVLPNVLLNLFHLGRAKNPLKCLSPPPPPPVKQ